MIDPFELFSESRFPDLDPEEGVLCWGKAALRTWQALSSRRRKIVGPALVIAPKGSSGMSPAGARVIFSEHPLPGDSSYEAGEAILDFFDALRRTQTRKLRVFLSGGASSLAWLRPHSISERELRSRLEMLYARPLSIAELNAKRSSLCALKAGGAARWLRKIAPHVKVRVEVISDVLPFGPEVVGSGPFAEPGIPHRVAADHRTLMREIGRLAKPLGYPVLGQWAGRVSPWREWADHLIENLDRALGAGKTGLLLMGGEPRIDLSAVSLEGGYGLGGRMTQIAATLAVDEWTALLTGEVEILCGSSDGVDGTSESSGAWLNEGLGRKLLNPKTRWNFQKAVLGLDSASCLRRWSALLPSRPTGTNVQDLVIIKVESLESSPSK